jgi:hypothetical protein
MMYRECCSMHEPRMAYPGVAQIVGGTVHLLFAAICGGTRLMTKSAETVIWGRQPYGGPYHSGCCGPVERFDPCCGSAHHCYCVECLPRVYRGDCCC